MPIDCFCQSSARQHMRSLEFEFTSHGHFATHCRQKIQTYAKTGGGVGVEWDKQLRATGWDSCQLRKPAPRHKPLCDFLFNVFERSKISHWHHSPVKTVRLATVSMKDPKHEPPHDHICGHTSILPSILLSVLFVHWGLKTKDVFSNFLWETMPRNGWSDTWRTRERWWEKKHSIKTGQWGMFIHFCEESDICTYWCCCHTVTSICYTVHSLLCGTVGDILASICELTYVSRFAQSD